MDRLSTTTILPDTFQGTRDDITGQIGLVWQQTKVPFMVPLLKLLVVVCLGMSLMLFMERVYMGIVIVFVKLFGRKPEKSYKCEPIRDDLELGHLAYPMVLVQIPMYNEKEVCLIALQSFQKKKICWFYVEILIISLQLNSLYLIMSSTIEQIFIDTHSTI